MRRSILAISLVGFVAITAAVGIGTQIPPKPVTAFSGALLHFDGELYPRWISCARLPSGDIRQLSMKYGITSYIAVPQGTCSQQLPLPEPKRYPLMWTARNGSLTSYGFMVRAACPPAVASDDIRSAIDLINQFVAAPGVPQATIAVAASAKSKFEVLDAQHIGFVYSPWIRLRAKWFERADKATNEIACGPPDAIATEEKLKRFN